MPVVPGFLVQMSNEETYFDKKNREAIERIAENKKDATPRMSPVSGKVMEQEVLNGVVIDRCTESGGIWLDAGELEQLMQIAKDSEHEEHTMYEVFRELSGLK